MLVTEMAVIARICNDGCRATAAVAVAVMEQSLAGAETATVAVGGAAAMSETTAVARPAAMTLAAAKAAM
jgi:hypothetical protein